MQIIPCCSHITVPHSLLGHILTNNIGGIQVKFEDDTIDETRELEYLLRGKIGLEGSKSAIQVDFAELRGTHATPLAQVSLSIPAPCQQSSL